MGGLLPDYGNQARRYDETRSAAPAVLDALRAALDGAPARRLADIGGGTGNYALALRDEGWDPVVADASAAMLERAAAKGLATLEADAQALPFDDASFDAAMLVSMLHHVPDPGAALREAARVIRPGGRVAVLVFTREDVEDLWLLDWFPSTRPWMLDTHPARGALLAQLPGASATALRYDAVDDGTLAALAGRPELILEERWRGRTSYFERLARDHPDELRAGLERLAADPPPGRAGTATVLGWAKPPAAA